MHKCSKHIVSISKQNKFIDTQALYDSRELAMERMQKEAEDLGAKGIVGANIHERTHAWGSHVIEFFALGTAVEEISDNHVIEPPQLVLPLVS